MASSRPLKDWKMYRLRVLEQANSQFIASQPGVKDVAVSYRRRLPPSEPPFVRRPEGNGPSRPGLPLRDIPQKSSFASALGKSGLSGSFDG